MFLFLVLSMLHCGTVRWCSSCYWCCVVVLCADVPRVINVVLWYCALMFLVLLRCVCCGVLGHVVCRCVWKDRLMHIHHSPRWGGGGVVVVDKKRSPNLPPLVDTTRSCLTFTFTLLNKIIKGVLFVTRLVDYPMQMHACVHSFISAFHSFVCTIYSTFLTFLLEWNRKHLRLYPLPFNI